MSFAYEEEEPYGPYRFQDDLPNLGPYENEDYSKKPVPSDKMPGVSHHPGCTYNHVDLETCQCFELYNKDYEDDQEREADENWRYYNGILDD